MEKRRFTKKEHVYKSHTINADSFDKRRFNELLHMSKGLQRVKHEGRNEPFFDQLMGDIWSSLYKASPRLLEDVPKELARNRSLMERLMNEEKYHETHEFTKLDDIHSALSTVGFSDKVLQWIEKQTDTNKNIQKSYQKMMEEEYKNGKSSKEYQKALQEYLQQMQNQIESNSPDLSQMLSESVEESKEMQKNLAQIVGGIEAGVGTNQALKDIPLRDVFTLAEYMKHNYKMKQIAQWAGRFKAIAKSKQKSMSKESISRSGVKIGNNIDRILPSELLNLSNPATKLDFLKRFAEGQTLEYATKGKQTLGRGPIILCLDQSGSMDELETQSKGFALALMSIAKKQKRNFALINFDVEVKVSKYNKGKITTGQMVELCQNFMGGGTNFQKPLEESLIILRSERFKNADIVFVTDGQAPIQQDFLDRFKREKEKHGFSVLSLLIGNHAGKNTVSRFSDEIHYAKDFTDQNAHEVFNI